MRYEDASHTDAFQGSGPIANDDLEVLAAGAKSAATGNLITGEGTQSGSAGADSAAGGHITAIAGKGGEDTSFAGGKLSVDGEYGRLSVDAEGNYVYQANKGVENVRDRFTYTLADNQGASDSASLIVEIGKTPVVIKANAQQIVPGPDGVVTLPPGVELSDVHVVGRNLVIDMPDGTQLIIIDGAVFVPQLVLGGVEIPATNVAALLVGQEIQPAAGEIPPSSGGNFAVPPPPLDPGVPLGDLIPPTEYVYQPPEPQPTFDVLNTEPEAGAASAILDDDAQAGGIAGGVGDDPGTNFASGNLPGSDGDGSLEWALLASGTLPSGFSFSPQGNGDLWVMQGATHVLTITVNPVNGDYTVTQVAAIDHPAGGDENNLIFIVNYSVTDDDGDSAVGTLTIDVDDDTPTIDTTVASDANVLLTTQDAQTDGDPTDTDTDSTSANFGGIFGVSSAFGADGAGSTSTSYALSTTGGASGLTQHGVAINLYLIGGVVVGSTAASAGAVNASNTVFDISVNASGVVTVNQYSQIDHTNTDPSPTGPGYEDHLISLADGSVTLTRTDSITDGDGDTATDSASVGIGANIRFADDGPSIDPTLNEVGAAIVDESEPVDTATIPLVGGYTAGDDPHLAGGLAIGKGSTSGPVIDANALFGADGPATGGGISYDLVVLNAVSGLTTTEGTAINLVELSNGVVVGVVDGTTTVAFAIQIDSATGVVTVEQYLSLFHPDSPNNFDEPVFLDEGSLGVTVTASDFDGDSVTSGAVDITSLIRFEDDGPSINPALNANATVTVDESLPSNTPGIDTGGIAKGDDPDLAGGVAIGQANSGSAIVNANAVFGADGPAAQGSIVYALSITNADPGVTLTDGTTITMQLVNGVIVGVVDSGPFAGQAAFAIAIDPSTGVVTVEQYLSLDHPLNPDPNDPLGLGDNTVAVNVTATDGDGDQVTSDDVDISGQITFLDDGPAVSPTLNAQVTVTVDESLPSTAPAINTGAIVKGNDPDLSDATGTALGQGNSGVAIVNANAVFGADGPAAGGGISYALSITNSNPGVTLTDGTTITMQLVGGVIVGVVDSGPFAGQAAFAIAINSSTGVVSVEQYLSLDHPVNPNPNDPLGLGDNTVAVTVTATDGDGDPVTSGAVDISHQITFLDDGPSADPVLDQEAVVQVDESLPSAAPAIDTLTVVKGDDPDLAGGIAIGSGNSGSAIIDVNAIFGADGPAAGGGISYALSIINASSGVTLTDGSAINLQLLANGVVVGVVASGVFAGQAAFAIAINPTTGVVSLEQYLSLDHPVNPNPNDPLGLGENTLGVTATVTDGDGDSITTDAVDISSNITFFDDGPSVDPALNVNATVTVDESLPSTAPAINTGAIVKGDDPDLSGGIALGQANSGSAIVNANAVFGADGPAISGSISYALSILNVSSGFTLTDGTPINLQMVGGVIVGVVSGGTFNGQAAFAIAINSSTGVVSVEQYLSLDHPLNPNPNDPLSFGSNIIGVTVTATDGDGDPVTSGAVDIGGQLIFLDDGPVANNDVDSIVGGLGPATGNVLTGVEVAVAEDANGTDGVADAPGADGGRITFIDHSNPAPGSVVPDGGSVSIAGDYGVLTIYSNGDYSYLRNDGTPGGVSDVFTYTLTDGDGDPTTATLTISIDDNFPTLPDPALVRLDDDVIPAAGGNVDGPSDDDPDTVGQNVVNGNLVGSGGDGDLDYFFTGLNTLPSGFSVNAAGLPGSIQILQGATVVMTITLNNETGAFTVTQNNPILHPADNGGPDDNIENNLLFSIGVQVQDADGDTEPATITINVDDDTPTIDVTKGSDAAVILTTDDADTIGVATDTAVTTANFGGVFGLTQSAGADGTAAAATLSFALDVTGYTGGPAGVNSGLESHDADIFLYEIGGKVVGSTSATLAGVNAGNTVFDVGVSGTGVVTLTQYSQIDHDTADPTPTGTPFADHIVSLTDSLVTLTASSSLTDNDGDTVTDSETVNIGANLRFTDDGPDAQLSGTGVGTVTLDETRPEGSDTPGGTAPTGDASATIDFSVNFVTGGSVDYGADGPGSVTYALQLTGSNVNSGLYALDGTDTETVIDGYGQGAQIVLNQVGNTITGSVGATNYFTITINPATGVVTFTQLNNIWHPTAGGASFDESATLNTLTANLIQVIQTVTDFDGDTDTASINIGQGVFIIQDSGPSVFDPEAIGAGELFNEAGSSATADLDVDANINNNVGTDTPGLVQFANIANGDDSGLTSGGDAIEYWLSNNGQTLQGRINSTDGSDGELIFTVQLNQGAGTYTVTMAGEIDNGAGVSFNSLTSTKAGNVDVRAVGADDPATTVDLLLTASGPGGVNATINTDSDSVGSGNQSMDQGETVRIDFVTNLQDDPADDLTTFPSGFSYDGHVGTNSLLQTIPQVQGNQAETVAFRVYALNTTVTDAALPDDYPGDGFSDASIVNTITHVTIDGFDVGETPVTVALGAVGVWTTIAYGVSAQRQADGSVIFSGVQEGDQYGITTSTDFNAFAVTSLPAGVGPVGNLSSTNSFDLGVFSIGQVDTGDPINITFDLKLTDADGDTITVTDALAIQIDPAASSPALLPPDPQSFSTLSTESLLVSDSGNDQQLQRTAANSNTLTMAAAVAATGLAETQAAASPPADDQPSDSLEAQVFTTQVVETLAADDGGDDGSAVSGLPETQEADEAPGNSGGHSQGDEHRSDASLDAASNNQSSEAGSSSHADNDQGPAAGNAAASNAAAPTVGMPSAEALAAAGLDGNAQHGGSVEEIVADALGHGNGQAVVDALLDAFHGGNGGGGAVIANLASPATNAVSAWDMASNAGSSGNYEMLMKVGAEMLHHDMVQPTHNG